MKLFRQFLYSLIGTFFREDDVELDENFSKKLKIIFISIIILTFAIQQWHQANYQVTHFSFICNDQSCKTTQYSSNGRIISTEQIDITKVKRFIAIREKMPFSNRIAPRIYAECYDGTKFLLSDVYIGNERYLDREYLIPLNKDLYSSPLDINFNFP